MLKHIKFLHLSAFLFFFALLIHSSPAAIQAASPSPSPTSTSQPRTALEGHVYIIDSEFYPLSGVAIMNVTNPNKPIQIATTDKDGFYEVTNLSPGNYVLSANLSSFETVSETVQLDPLPKEIIQDFYLKPISDNKIQGTVTKSDGTPIQVASIALMQGPAIYKLVEADEKGAYEIRGIIKGDYTLRVIKSIIMLSNPSFFATSPANPEVKFSQDRGQTLTQNLIVTESFSPKITLTVHTFKRLGHTAMPGEEITGIELELTKADTENETPLGKKNSPAQFENLDPGYYTIESSATAKWEEDSTTLFLANPNEELELLLEPIDTECEKHPQANVDQFWFCGAEAKALHSNTAYASHWTSIDTTIGALRTQYGRTDLPQRVKIISTDMTNAFYVPAEAEKGACPAPMTSSIDEPAEDIIFTSGIVKRGNAAFMADPITIHEWGHGDDRREGNCITFRSEEEPFTLLRLAGEAFGEQFFYPIKDSTYHNDGSLLGATVGHPEENNIETAASLFHALHHLPKFSEIITNYPPSLKDILQKLVTLIQT